MNRRPFLETAALLLSRRINVNEFTLRYFYRNRLVRCCLGASRWPQPPAEPVTGFDSRDDFHLTALAPLAGYGRP